MRPKQFIHLNLVSNEEKEKDDEFKSECLLLKLYGDISTIKNKRRPIEMEDIGRSEDQSVVRHILVEGSPGIGKTMLSWELCRQWAEGKMLQDSDIVLMLQLRKKRVREANNLSDLFYHDDDTIKQEVLSHVKSVEGKGVFLILEGYDELSEDHRTDDNVINQLLIGDECLPRATIMITSRPLASDSLCCEFRESIDQHIEVVGFNDDDIKSYLEIACQNHPEVLADFKSYLESNPFVSSIMYIPLQCAIITGLYIEKWTKNKGKAYAPTTLTQLYTDVLLSSLIRYINDHPVYSEGKRKITELSDMHSEVQKQFWKLSQLAAEGLEKKLFIFDSIPCDHMGLMQSAEEELIFGSTVSYCFLHLTLQEYLAALHWSRMGSEDIVRLVNETSLFPLDTLVRDGITTGYFWPALYFLSGLTKLSLVPIELLNKSLKAADNMLPDGDNLGLKIATALEFFDVDIASLVAATMNRKKCNPYFFQVLFETQSHELTTRLFANENIIPTITNPLECFVTAWCVANSDPTSLWSLELESISLLDKFVQHFDRFASNKSSYGRVTWIWLADIHQEDATAELGRSLSKLFPSLEGLALYPMKLESIKQIFPMLDNLLKLTTSLQALVVNTYKAKGELPAVVSIPELHCPSLKSVWLQGVGSASLIPSLVLPNISTLVNILFMKYCTRMSDLNFSDFCTSLRQSTNLESFCWYKVSLNAYKLNELVSALEQIHSLKIVKYNERIILTDLAFDHVVRAINSIELINFLVTKEQLEDVLHKFFSPLRSLTSNQEFSQLVPTDIPTSSQFVAEEDEESDVEAEDYDENLKLVLSIIVHMQRAKCELRKQQLQSQENERRALESRPCAELQSVKHDEQIEDILHKFFSPLRSLPQLEPVDVPTSYNHLTEIDEQNSEDYRSLSLGEEAESQDKSLKLVLPILASIEREKCELRKRTATTDAEQKSLKSMKCDEELD